MPSLNNEARGKYLNLRFNSCISAIMTGIHSEVTMVPGSMLLCFYPLIYCHVESIYVVSEF